MANAGGAWDNAKKIVEVELKEKGTPLHAATVIGDTVGDPFKDTSSVAMNPVIKFTTLFGLLAVELAVTLTAERGPFLSRGARRGLLRGVGRVRLAFVLRHAHPGQRAPAAGAPAGRVAVRRARQVAPGGIPLRRRQRSLLARRPDSLGRLRPPVRDRLHRDRPSPRLLPAGRLAPDHGGRRGRCGRVSTSGGSTLSSSSPAITGDSVGYAIGVRLGPRLFTRPKSLLFNPASHRADPGVLRAPRVEDDRHRPIRPDHPDLRAGRRGRRSDGIPPLPLLQCGGRCWMGDQHDVGGLSAPVRVIPNIGELRPHRRRGGDRALRHPHLRRDRPGASAAVGLILSGFASVVGRLPRRPATHGWAVGSAISPTWRSRAVGGWRWRISGWRSRTWRRPIGAESAAGRSSTSGSMFVEFCAAMTAPPEQILAGITVVGLEHLKDAMAKHGRALVSPPISGNWELLALAHRAHGLSRRRSSCEPPRRRLARRDGGSAAAAVEDRADR